MVFTTTIFTYMFFPLAIILWLIGKAIDKKTALIKTRVADIVLILISAVFFGWNNFEMIWWLVIFIGAVYVFGLLIEQAGLNHEKKLQKNTLISGVIILVALLGYYKYRAFTFEIINQIFASDLVVKTVATPLALSFLVFTAISYLADVYMGKARAGSLLDCALYLSFFPKLISGPIVLWRDFKPQIGDRCLNRDQICTGIQRICVGYGKKLILADTFGRVIALIDSNYAGMGIDSPTAWIAVILYWLQIYYDFSGYSDIAVGLSKILGFEFLENFNFPYISSSIAEFWRRWHISLGTWFRQYIYIPLGGSRKGKYMTVLNLAIVFMLTGIWHGAGYNYLLWGAINGFFVIFDHVLKDNRLWNKVPRIFKWAGTVIISIGFWELFRFSTITEVYCWLCVMIGHKTYSGYTFSWPYFYNASTITFIVIGILGATVLGTQAIQNFLNNQKGKVWFEIVKGVGCLLLFVLSIIFMTNSTYSPFIYFQY